MVRLPLERIAAMFWDRCFAVKLSTIAMSIAAGGPAFDFGFLCNKLIVGAHLFKTEPRLGAPSLPQTGVPRFG